MRRSIGTPALRSTIALYNLDGQTHCVDHAAELDEAAVAGALDDAAVMGVDGGIDQGLAPQAPHPRQRAILVGAGEPAVADDVRDQNRSDFRVPAIARPHAPRRIAQRPAGHARL